MLLLNLGGPLVTSQAAWYPLLPHAGGVSPEKLVSPGRLRSRRRTRPSSAALGPLFLHPSGSPEGVPASLFKLDRPRSTRPPTDPAPRSTSAPGSGEVEGLATAVATTPSVIEEVVEALDVRLVEEADLPDISALLADVFEPSILIDPAELRSESSLEKLERANQYLKGMAYKKILRAIKSRCGSRLRRGDFALTSDALVLAVRDDRSSASASAVSTDEEQGQQLGSDGDGNRDGEVVAVVELCLRQPDGWLPFNGFLQPPMGWEPYMCNLAVAEKYRGNGYGKQLALLCENVAKNHWGYERMYLHVDAASPVAMDLYSSLGYEIKEQFEAPMWMKRFLGLRDIKYQVKHFDGRRGPVIGGD